MSALSKLVAQKIRTKRRELGVTQQELGLILGCTFQSIQHYEQGFCQMPIYMLNDFALLCKVPVDWFFLEDYQMLVHINFL